MPYFNSTAIERAEYDADTRVLAIWFVGGDGQPYYYDGVNESVFVGLCGAASKGQYFNDLIKDRYPVSR